MCHRKVCSELKGTKVDASKEIEGATIQEVNNEVLICFFS